MLKPWITIIFMGAIALLISRHFLVSNVCQSDMWIAQSFGQTQCKYHVSYPIQDKSQSNVTTEKTSEWIDVQHLLYTHGCLTFETKPFSFVDILIFNSRWIRINSNSIVKIRTSESNRIELNIYQGQVISFLEQPSSNRIHLIAHLIEAARLETMGANFCLSYDNNQKIFQLTVKNGTITMLDPRVSTHPISITDASNPLDQIKQNDISNSVVVEKNTKCIESIDTFIHETESMLHTSFFKPFQLLMSEIHDQIQTWRTQLDMRDVQGYFVNYKQLNSNSILPKSLSDLGIKNEQFQDSWGMPYLYERISENQTILISSGPDRIMYSPDDLFYEI
ncbi:MAG: hypothetical protein HQK77_21580 [Desulfobacterales bacterium]|nr:hypothetical protein [Desulfobacterales bacterium]